MGCPRVFNFEARNVGEVRVAHLRVRVPLIHRVDCFRELTAARLVYAAGVHPRPSVSVLLCQTAEFANLWGELGTVSGASTSAFTLLAYVANILECLLLPLPGVREDRVASVSVEVPGKVLELGSFGVKQPHCDLCAR